MRSVLEDLNYQLWPSLVLKDHDVLATYGRKGSGIFALPSEGYRGSKRTSALRAELVSCENYKLLKNRQYV